MRKITYVLISLLLSVNAHAATTYKTNWAYGTTSSAISLGDSVGATFTVTSGTNSGSFSTSGNFYIIVYSSSCNNPKSCANREILLVSQTGGTFTIQGRAQESTTQQAWASGSKVEHAFTAGILGEYATLVDPTFTNDITVTGTATISGDATVTGEVTGKVKIANYTTSQNPLAVSSRTVVTNTGASGTLTHVLPACTGDGTVITFWLTSTNAIKIDPNGTDQIITDTDAAGDSLTSDTTVDTRITVVCLESAKWHVDGKEGTWTDTN